MKKPANPCLGAGALAVYAAAIFAANWTTNHYGLVYLGLGFTVTSGTFFAGAALMLRNQVQDWLGRPFVFVAIVAGALLSAWTSPSLAKASALAFVLGEGFDMAVYTPLRKHGWGRAALTAAPVGSIVDTLVFLGIAGFPLTFQSIGGQFTVKTLVTWATVGIATGIRKWRSERRDQASPDPVTV
jgi:uncharacterized PurR-regulated membrane protein YhhQ (DUF165 family)